MDRDWLIGIISDAIYNSPVSSDYGKARAALAAIEAAGYQLVQFRTVERPKIIIDDIADDTCLSPMKQSKE
jgi:hypothetical protein